MNRDSADGEAESSGPIAVSSMPAPPLGKADQSATGESGRRKKVLWTVLFLAALAFLGSYIAVIAYVRFGGQAVKDFCSQELIGKSAPETKALAAGSGLAIIEREGSLRVTTDPSMSRHTCDLKLDAGKVKSAKAYFRF
ncbi:MAG: hypothetical protein HZB40_21190 [Rhodocyclales bacterium]|nr:hypothetical protein [Rhodocyclales bacterium]